VLLMTNWPLRCVVLHNADLSKPDEHQNLIHGASNRDVVCMYLRYGVYGSPIPASFLRSAPSIMARSRCATPPLSPQTIRCCRPEDCLAIILTSEIWRGATGVIHRGTPMPVMQYRLMSLLSLHSTLNSGRHSRLNTMSIAV
jgi:hypothetical protein